MIKTLYKKGEADQFGNVSPDMIQVSFDSLFFEEMQRDGAYGCMTGVVDRVADKIADRIYPEIEQKIMSDPKLSDCLINEVLVKLTNRLAAKGLISEDNG